VFDLRGSKKVAPGLHVDLQNMRLCNYFFILSCLQSFLHLIFICKTNGMLLVCNVATRGIAVVHKDCATRLFFAAKRCSPILANAQDRGVRKMARRLLQAVCEKRL
jgi:hypothetical protein